MEQLGQLRLTFLPDDPPSMGELIAQVSSSGFCGQGQAWFNVSEIDGFAAELATMPLSPNQTVSLEGGYWSTEQSGTLEQVHVSIRVYPIGTKGQVGVRVHLADRLERNDRRESQNQATVELKTTYGALESFARDLRRLQLSQANEAILHEETLL